MDGVDGMSGLGIFEPVFLDGCVRATVPQPFRNRSETVPQPFRNQRRNRCLHRKPYNCISGMGGLSSIGRQKKSDSGAFCGQLCAESQSNLEVEK